MIGGPGASTHAVGAARTYRFLRQPSECQTGITGSAPSFPIARLRLACGLPVNSSSKLMIEHPRGPALIPYDVTYHVEDSTSRHGARRRLRQA
jgi:hypothetical protein